MNDDKPFERGQIKTLWQAICDYVYESSNEEDEKEDTDD